MSWPSINSTDFLDLRGIPVPPMDGMEMLQRPGVDGQGYRLIGKRGEVFGLETITALGTGGTADSQLATFIGWVTTLVSVTLPTGENFNNIRVIAVRCVGTQKLGTSTAGPGGTPNELMTCQWTMQSNDY